MKRQVLIGSPLLLALLGCLIAFGFGAASGRQPEAGTRPPSANARLARRTAAHLLQALPLPPGARRVSSDESAGSHLGGPASTPQHTAQFVGMHRFWRVAPGPESVIAWFDEHPPAGSTIITRGSSGAATSRPPRSLHGEALGSYVRKHSLTTEWDTTFAFPPSRERLATVWLSVSVAAATGGGSAVRADSLVVWRRPRPALEHVPAGIRAVSVKVSDPRRHIRFAREISSPVEVEAIVAAIEGLQRPEGGAASCPADTGKATVIDLLFRRQASTPPSVRVRIDDNGCGSVSFSRDGRKLPHLGTAYEAVKQLHRILGGVL